MPWTFVTLPRTNISSSPVLLFWSADRSQTTERMAKQYTNKSVASLQVIIWTESKRWQQLNAHFQLHGLVQFRSVSQDIHGNLEFVTAFRGAITWVLWPNKFTPQTLGSLMSLLKHPPPLQIRLKSPKWHCHFNFFLLMLCRHTAYLTCMLHVQSVFSLLYSSSLYFKV
jgi:hypothetical protein